MTTTDTEDVPLEQREWLSPADIAAYLNISRTAAYRLAHDLGGRRRGRVGVRVRRSKIDQHMEAPPPAPAPLVVVGTPIAEPADEDDEEVLPGLTRRQLKEQAGF